MVDQNQLEYLEYLKYFCSLITNYARCIREFKARISMAKAAFKKTHQKIGLRFKEETNEILYFEHSFFLWC